MEVWHASLNRIVTSFVLAVTISGTSFAQSDGSAESLLDQLAQPDLEGWEQIEDQIWREWSKSGSPAMDLLLKRGRDAMEAEDWNTAIEHLTALTDHAPNFAEGWNARATAFYNAGMLGQSVSDIEHALSLNPNHFGALTGLAIIFEELGMKEKALAAARAAQELNPHRDNVNQAVDRLEKEVLGRTL